MEPVVNKRARFDYSILETLEAGLALLGHEVKAIKTGKASIVGSYVKIYGNEAWLVGAQIGPYQEKNTPAGYDPKRPRKLLLRHEQIKTLTGKAHEKRLTIVPLKLYNKSGRVKLEIALAKSKKAPDKRESIKRRDMEREAGRRFK
jgi:SsrA-binding protein